MIRYISLFLLAALALGSCKSDSTSSNNNPSVAASSMTATVNGKAWKSDGVKGFRHAGPLSNIQFEGWTNSPFVQIPFGVAPSVTAPGTYPITLDNSGTGTDASAAYNTLDASYSDNVSGSITITSLTDKNIQGSFDFFAISGFHGDTVHV